MLSKEELGSYLQKIRQEKDISLRDVYDKTGISYSHLSMIENGKRNVTPALLRNLAQLYNIDYIDLYEKAGYVELAEKEKLSNVFPTTDIPQKYPVLGKISAGLPLLAVENVEGYMYAPSSKIQQGYDYFFLRVQRR